MNQTSSRRILLLAPHQDDECLQTAGIIYQAAHSGAHVSVCFATNGEYASEADAAVRAAESRSVLAALGVPAEQIYFLGYPDTGMPYEESFLRRLYDGCRVSASRWGRTETWRPDGQDFHFMRSGCHGTYTAASVLRDLSDVLALVNPGGRHVVYHLPHLLCFRRCIYLHQPARKRVGEITSALQGGAHRSLLPVFFREAYPPRRLPFSIRYVKNRRKNCGIAT